MADNLPDKLQLELVTPDRPVAHGSVTEVYLPGKDGYLGVLPGHAPLISLLKPGELSYKQDSTMHYLAIGRGFVEVLPDRVIVLADSSEKPHEIDVERANRAKHEAEQILNSNPESEADRDRAQAALDRATARLEVARKAGSPSA
jgi:F-type H+-transporting ATPase subunit epsilon